MINIFTRFVCRYMCSYHSWLRNYSKKFVDLPSALYIGYEHKATVFSSLDPYIDTNQVFSNIEKLKADLHYRNINVDVESLYQQSLIYERLFELIKYTKKNIDRFNIELKKLSSEEVDATTEDSILSIQAKISDARDLLSTAREEFMLLEKTFILPFLQLPNGLHKNTTANDECLFCLFPKPRFSFDVKSHVDIGTANDELHFKNVSPTSYYLKGNLALLELAMSDFVMFRFQEHDFKSVASIDTARAVLAEGCGFNLKENSYLQIEDDDCLSFNQIQYLFGSSSLTSFVTLFCKGLVTMNEDLPIRLVSTGRKYDVSDIAQKNYETQSLFTAVQSTCVSAFVVYPSEGSEEAVVNEIAMLITQIYTELGLHFILMQYGASKLKPYESLAIGICMYSPYYRKYVEVGRISLCQDFISKRLQIFQILGKKKASFLGMIYVEILDIKNWIGCVLENTQTGDGQYSIPKCLQPFLYTKT